MSYERGRRSIASNMATRGRVWSDDEVAALLACWSEDSIQRQLLGAVRNTVPYKAIAKELSRQGFSRDFKQCREKIKALKKRYKEVVDAQRRSGAGVESDDDDLEDVPGFRWFAEIHSVMRTRAVVSPPALLDTSVAAEEQPRTPSVGEDRPRTPAVAPEERPRTPSVAMQPGPSAEDVPGPSSAAATVQPRLPKKRRPTKLDKAEKANKAMMDAFQEMEEKSREQDRVQDRHRMKELRKLRRSEEKREKHFLEFLKDLFMQGPQQQYPAPIMPHQPFPLPMPG